MHSVPSRQHTFFVGPPLLIAVRSISHRTPTAPLGTKTGQVRLSESGVTSKSHRHNLLIPWPNGLFDGFQQLAIIDLELPEQSGWDLISRLTLHDRKPVKIIATTSVYAEPILEKMKAIGIDAVVRKPMPNEEWRTTLEIVMAGT